MKIQSDKELKEFLKTNAPEAPAAAKNLRSKIAEELGEPWYKRRDTKLRAFAAVALLALSIWQLAPQPNGEDPNDYIAAAADEFAFGVLEDESIGSDYAELALSID